MRAFFVMLFVVFAGFFCFSQSADWYRGKPIADIAFDGLKNIRSADMESTIAPFRGKIFTDELYLDLQSRLYALDYFERITPTALPSDSSGSGVVILFKVVELPVISQIIFSGNSGLKRRELMDAISLKVNDIVNSMLVQADAAAIKNKYLEKGYPDARVSPLLQKGKNDSMVLTFTIAEGERTTVTDVFFEGNSIYSSSTLKGRLSMKPKGLGRDGAFQDAKLLADRESVTQYYHDRGYLDAEVTDIIQDLVRDEKGNNNLTITYRIYEGRIYTFAGIRFEGNDIFNTQDLQKLLRSKTGEIANASKVEADIQRVADLYSENGYIFNSIDREEIRNAEEGTIAYVISIIERGRAHIENIIIKGNQKTKDFVILREIPLESGDVFSKTKVMEGLRSLYNLQYFSAVIPDPSPGSADSLMDLVVSVEEQPTTEVQFGLTFAGSADPDAFPVSAVLSLSDRNFLGYGSHVRGELTASPDMQSLSLQYSERWLKELPLSWGVDLTLSHATKYTPINNGRKGPVWDTNKEPAYPDAFDSYEDYRNATEIPKEFLMSYEQWFVSLGLSTTYRWGTPLGVLGAGGGIRTGLIHNSYNEIMRPFDPVIRDRNGLWTPVNSIWTLVYLDRRDLAYDPSSGYYGSQRFTFYGVFPVEQEHYIKSDTKAESFFTLLNIPVTEKWNFKTVLALHSGLSFILPQLGMSDPVVEETNMLLIDGMFIGRGWYGERVLSRRGFALWENSVELRIPIVHNFLAFDWFLDAAVVKKTPYEFFHQLEAENWRFSLGGGLRFTIPQFPFRFLLAKRFVLDRNGTVRWQKGNMFHNPSDPTSGLDFVISFALTTY